MKKKPVIWLARDKTGSECYEMSVGKAPSDGGHGLFWGDATYPPKAFESIAPKSCHLKPGEGPIKISIDIKRSK